VLVVWEGPERGRAPSIGVGEEARDLKRWRNDRLVLMVVMAALRP
jgi:hypothetical protein